MRTPLALIVALLINNNLVAHPHDKSAEVALRAQLQQLRAEIASLRLENAKLKRELENAKFEAGRADDDRGSEPKDDSISDIRARVSRTQVIGLTVAEEQQRSVLLSELDAATSKLTALREQLGDMETDNRRASGSDQSRPHSSRTIGKAKAEIIKAERNERRIRRELTVLDRDKSSNRVLIDASLIDGSGHAIQILVFPPLTERLRAIPIGTVIEANGRPLFIEPGRTGYRATSITVLREDTGDP